MRKNPKKMIAAASMMLGVLLYFAEPVQAKTVRLVVKPLYKGSKVTVRDIQRYLDLPLENSKNHYVITVPKGTYKLNSSLHIYSNTTLKLKKAVFKHPGFFIGSMIQVGYPRKEKGRSTSKGGGYTKGGYKRGQNIKILGGTFHAGRGPVDAVSSMFTFSHVKNLQLVGSKFVYKPKRMDNAHMIEFGAAKNVRIRNCTFLSNGKVEEAIQIESAGKGVAHSDLMGKEDGTRTKNVKISGNKFYNFPYAIGTNHGTPKDLYTGMVVMGNHFHNIKKYVLCTYNYKRAVIRGNKVRGGKRKFRLYILKLGRKDSYRMSKNKVYYRRKR